MANAFCMAIDVVIGRVRVDCLLVVYVFDTV